MDKVSKITVEFDHSSLSKLYLGKFGEQLVKLSFIVNGIDTYEPVIDDRGIDFIARVTDQKFFDVQVKSVRLPQGNYIYVTKKSWRGVLRDNLLVAIVVLENDQPLKMLLIPAKAWQTDKTQNVFSDRDYVGKISKPEWGLAINQRTLKYLLKEYSIEKTISKLLKNTESDPVVVSQAY